MPYIPVSDAQLARWGITQAQFAEAKSDHYARLERLLGSAHAPFYDVKIDGTDHVSFSDLHLLIRLPSNALGDVRRSHRIINAYTLDFFERYLNQGVAPLSDGHSAPPFPEVSVRTRNVTGSALALSQ